MTGEAVTARASAQVVSAVPGRLRLRVLRGARTGEELARLARALESVPGVTDVELRPTAASAIVRFDPGEVAGVGDALRGLGIDPPQAPAPRERDPAHVVAASAGVLNEAIARRTGGDLRLFVPLGLGLLSLRQALRGGDRLGEAPWYLIAWYASETFFKFHGAPTAARPADEGQEEA